MKFVKKVITFQMFEWRYEVCEPFEALDMTLDI